MKKGLRAAFSKGHYPRGQHKGEPHSKRRPVIGRCPFSSSFFSDIELPIYHYANLESPPSQLSAFPFFYCLCARQYSSPCARILILF